MLCWRRPDISGHFQRQLTLQMRQSARLQCSNALAHERRMASSSAASAAQPKAGVCLFWLTLLKGKHERYNPDGCVLQGGAGGEAISMGFGCLPEDAPAVLGMFSDLITSPALPQQRIDLYKAQVRPLKISTGSQRDPSEVPSFATSVGGCACGPRHVQRPDHLAAIAAVAHRHGRGAGKIVRVSRTNFQRLDGRSLMSAGGCACGTWHVQRSPF